MEEEGLKVLVEILNILREDPNLKRVLRSHTLDKVDKLLEKFKHPYLLDKLGKELF